MSTTTLKSWESDSTTTVGSSTTSTASSTTTDKDEVKRPTSAPSDVLKKDGMNRCLNNLPFDDPYYAAARLGDSHETRLKEHMRRIEEAFS